MSISPDVSVSDVSVSTTAEAVADRDGSVSLNDPAPVTPSFQDLGLPRALTGALTKEGIADPFPIQSATLPDALAGRDVLGRAQTGSGKTLAFGLAILARLRGERAAPNRPLGIVLVPTRELALQVHDVLAPYSQAAGVRSRPIVGGASMSRQIAELRRGVEVLVATPGRLIDHIRQGNCALNEVVITALDEADQMADMGFLPQVRQILDDTPGDGQRLLFSATLDNEVDALVSKYLTDPVTHSVISESTGVSTMEHHLLYVNGGTKFQVLSEIGCRSARTIMFVRTKRGADRLAGRLADRGVRVGSLHGDKTQGARNRTLDDFRAGRTPVLVATDVAARGIHVDEVGLVVHVDPPGDHKAYLHRAGRTARAGEKGTVFTIVLPDQRKTVRRLTELAGIEPKTRQVTPGDEHLTALIEELTPVEVVETAPPAKARRGERSGGSRRDERPRRDGARGGFAGRDRDGQRGRDDRGREWSGNGRDRAENSRGGFRDRDDRRPTTGRSDEGRGRGGFGRAERPGADRDRRDSWSRDGAARRDDRGVGRDGDRDGGGWSERRGASGFRGDDRGGRGFDSRGRDDRAPRGDRGTGSTWRDSRETGRQDFRGGPRDGAGFRDSRRDDAPRRPRRDDRGFGGHEVRSDRGTAGQARGGFRADRGGPERAGDHGTNRAERRLAEFGTADRFRGKSPRAGRDDRSGSWERGGPRRRGDHAGGRDGRGR